MLHHYTTHDRPALLLLLPLVLCLSAVTALGQQSGSPQIPQSVIAGGGGTSTNSKTRLEGTIGQAALGISTSVGYTLVGGFWGAYFSLCAAPNLVSPPINQAVCIGAPATFSVLASGDGLSYQWRKNGQSIMGATSASLTLNAVAMNDAGPYDVIITGDCGQLVSSAATLTVNPLPSAPIITPTPTTVCASSTGNSASTTATGLSYKWTIINGTINSADNTSSVVYTAGSGASNGGQVTLRLMVTNASGCSTSQSLNVPINTAPPSISTQPTGQQAIVGAQISFSVVASGTGYFSPINGARAALRSRAPLAAAITSAQSSSRMLALTMSWSKGHAARRRAKASRWASTAPRSLSLRPR